MNDSSRHYNYSDFWKQCWDQGYVVPRVYQCFQTLSFFVGFPALVWCLWISLSGSLSGGLKPTLVFPINLLVVEVLFFVEGLLEVVYDIICQNMILQQVTYASYILSWTCRPLFQSCICVEHYIAVAQPVFFLKYRLRRYRVVCSTLVWLLSLLHACFMTFKVTEGRINYVIMIMNCVGVVIISLCCFSILRVLKKPGPGEVEGGKRGEKKQGTTDPQKSRAFGIILTNLEIILASSLTLVVGYAALSSQSLYYQCNVFPIILIINILTVMASPLMLLYRERKLPCRRGTEEH